MQQSIFSLALLQGFFGDNLTGNNLLVLVLAVLAVLVFLVLVILVLYFFVRKKKQLQGQSSPPQTFSAKQFPKPKSEQSLQTTPVQETTHKTTSFFWHEPSAKANVLSDESPATMPKPAAGLLQTSEDSKPPVTFISPQEAADVKKLLEVLEPEKQNYDKLQILQVILEKGYSELVAKEVVHRLYEL